METLCYFYLCSTGPGAGPGGGGPAPRRSGPRPGREEGAGGRGRGPPSPSAARGVGAPAALQPGSGEAAGPRPTRPRLTPRPTCGCLRGGTRLGRGRSRSGRAGRPAGTDPSGRRRRRRRRRPPGSASASAGPDPAAQPPPPPQSASAPSRSVCFCFVLPSNTGARERRLLAEARRPAGQSWRWSGRCGGKGREVKRGKPGRGAGRRMRVGLRVRGRVGGAAGWRRRRKGSAPRRGPRTHSLRGAVSNPA
ncbi:unnamed protein product [Nyctereutes procyonoides]|uniref:(raccoon dog) hypothetical protein n=1 Tax=Nyctereutes procyonoides TaxID=34880 RepID=A0A811ZCU0_NYCPR|nr:unnamed protein product [Nyctereutes procyonoides]